MLILNPLPLVREEPKWGPSGQDVYKRTYSRRMSNGHMETWWDTVNRVVDGNLNLAPGSVEPGEREALVDAIYNFKLLPAGRHLWMSGVEGRQFLFNCYVSGWNPDDMSEHFTFTFNQLMEGGGVGTNYSQGIMPEYKIRNLVNIHIIVDPEHKDYRAIKQAELDSDNIHVIPSLAKAPYIAQKGGVCNRIDDTREGWAEALKLIIDAATETNPNPVFLDSESGEYIVHVVLDLSHIRPAGAPIRTFGGTAAGPLPLIRLLWEAVRILGSGWVNGWSAVEAMALDHAIAECVVSGNVRRSARMSMLHWKDYMIDWFIDCKKDGMSFWSTNISVVVDDEFWQEAEREDSRARHLLQKIATGMLRNGEPGIFNIDLARQDDPNIIATNPCGEIPLEAWENCNLGHVNLDALADSSQDEILEMHRLMTRFLMRATFGDISNEKTAEVVHRNRRIGVGHTGVAGYLAKKGIKYSCADRNDEFRSLLNLCYIQVRYTAKQYAEKLGIPVPIKLTTVAPTGTVSKMPGVTEGIHPPYAKYFLRRVRYSTVDPIAIKMTNLAKKQGFRVVDDIYAPNTVVVEKPTKELLVSDLEGNFYERYIESVDELSLIDCLAFQAMYQELWADNAVSYTINVQQGWYDETDVVSALLTYGPKLKGTTLMVDESRELAPYQRITKEVYDRYKNGGVDASYDEACASGACPVK